MHLRSRLNFKNVTRLGMPIVSSSPNDRYIMYFEINLIGKQEFCYRLKKCKYQSTIRCYINVNLNCMQFWFLLPKKVCAKCINKIDKYSDILRKYYYVHSFDLNIQHAMKHTELISHSY